MPMTFFLIFVFAVLVSADSKDTQYECGAHGRFEYCIDGIPGCVIGCHCHPGYYFDTDTKICEPNTKLLESYRRQYSAEPTRTPLSQMDYPDVIEQTTFFPTERPIDDHVDTIAKNADDLGDWLYDQFYKTIESQVINNTNANIITRRSGKRPEIKIIKKNRRKSEKKSSVKRKQKKDDLRRKLLRITEDDSLFDSDTETDSSDTSSSKETHESNDKEHGHKKFVIMNKKPKPPLPSFIFLPNVETPFYPPIGLPPPVLPMYPMVPVPPVLPPVYPYPNVSPDCDERNSTSSTSSSTVSTATIASSAPITTEVTTKPHQDTTTDFITSVHPSSTADYKHVMQTKSRKKKNLPNSGNDTLRRLRQLVQNSGLKKRQKAHKVFDEVVHREPGDTDEALQVEPVISDDFQHNNSPVVEDKANFKYLSELIHKIDGNDKVQTVVPNLKLNSRNHKPYLNNQRKKKIVQLPLKTDELSRRFNPMNSQKSKKSEVFYSNLGKQIASLIRDVNSKNDRHIDIEIEHTDHNTPSYPLLSELGYAPHSYWERFARSPVDYMEKYRKSHRYFKKSNEMLYNIEDKVEIAASTNPPMSLQEIENFISELRNPVGEILETASKIYQPYNNALNIKLWPREVPTIEATINPIIPLVKKSQHYINDTDRIIAGNNLISNSKAIRLRKIFDLWLTADHNTDNIQRNKQNEKIDKPSYEGTRKSFHPVIDMPVPNSNQNKARNYAKLPIKQLKQESVKPAKTPEVELQSLSHVYNYSNKRVNVKYQYPFYNNLLQFKFPTVEKTINIPFLRTESPSYFQHEVHHFDYFD